MASWREIDRIRKAPAEFHAVAKRLVNLGAELTEWESTFVESICNDTETGNSRHDSRKSFCKFGTTTRRSPSSTGSVLRRCLINVGTPGAIFRKAKNRSSKKCESKATFQ